MSSREPVITVDGPAGAGKSTASRELARRLGYRLLDTGAMYRAVALSVLRAGLPPEDSAALRSHLARLRLESDGVRVWIDGEEVTSRIRTPEVSELTSRLTTLRPVRDAVTPLQRRLAAAGGVVLEGRDTGTVVCPDADIKFYVDAALDARARRRHAELGERGVATSLDAVRKEIERRDEQDMGRALAPLRKPVDAIVLDTTDLEVDQVVERMLEAVERRRCSTRS
jgi:CMP/dCMP kinase